jgi:hypothetical protein
VLALHYNNKILETMKKSLIYLILLTIFISCEDVLDKRDLNAIDDTDVWNNEILANLYLNKVYRNILPGFGGSSNTNLSDESALTGEEENATNRVYKDIMYGELALDASYGNFGVTPYSNIRDLNLLIDEIEKGSIEPEIRAQIKGQALFLRAWVYWDLVKLYGGVPLVLHQLDPFNRDGLMIERSSARECIEQIKKDLDDAIQGLPPSWSADEWGRITRGGAAALKGRVLLFYASPQFNPDGLPERWDSAYQANLEAKEMCLADGYELNDNFERIFLDEQSSKEAIFIKVYDGVDISHGYENSVRPRSECEDGGNSNNPTWEFVKAFPMVNGLPVDDPASGYDSAYFWKNRDPRFYSTVAYNGCLWELSGKTGRRQWNYVGNGIEPSSPVMGASNTGFYCRKNVNESIESTETPRVATDWIEIRLAEVLLNLAECAAELGRLDEAKAELIAIRKRAGIEEGDGSYGITAASVADMVIAVMNERRIELAYENKRHWDLRRRNWFAEDYGSVKRLNGTRRHGIRTVLDTVYIMSLDPSITSGSQAIDYFNQNIRDTIDIENDYYRYFITEWGWNRDEEDINYLQPKYNFYFMPLSELDKNEKLKQTIYWGEADVFDPLAD